jgi:hypothetical protein
MWGPRPGGREDHKIIESMTVKLYFSTWTAYTSAVSRQLASLNGKNINSTTTATSGASSMTFSELLSAILRDLMLRSRCGRCRLL